VINVGIKKGSTDEFTFEVKKKKKVENNIVMREVEVRQ
jgi:hypothetical protein